MTPLQKDPTQLRTISETEGDLQRILQRFLQRFLQRIIRDSIRARAGHGHETGTRRAQAWRQFFAELREPGISRAQAPKQKFANDKTLDFDRNELAHAGDDRTWTLTATSWAQAPRQIFGRRKTHRPGTKLGTSSEASFRQARPRTRRPGASRVQSRAQASKQIFGRPRTHRPGTSRAQGRAQAPKQIFGRPRTVD